MEKYSEKQELFWEKFDG